MFLGIVSNPPKGAQSEREAWEQVYAFADELSRNTGGSWRNRVLAIRDLAWKMMRQVKSGVHVNGRGIKTSDDVQAIVYRHEEDGKLYVHGFGDADLDLTTRDGKLIIDGLKDETDVQMFAQPDGSVRIASRDGSPVWEDM